MKRRKLGGSGVDSRIVVLVPTLAAACATVTFLSLSALVRPANLNARTAGLVQQAQQARSLASAPGDPNAYPKGAICKGVDVGAVRVKQLVSDHANAASVMLANLTVMPAPSGQPTAGLSVLKLQFEANGHYDSELLFLNLLAKAEPEIFVDVVDLKPQASNVNLKLQGRVYCSAGARS